MTEPEKRGRGRPRKPGGPRLPHSVRVETDVWNAAEAVAKERGETLGQIVEAALKRYIARHRKRV